MLPLARTDSERALQTIWGIALLDPKTLKWVNMKGMYIPCDL